MFILHDFPSAIYEGYIFKARIGIFSLLTQTIPTEKNFMFYHRTKLNFVIIHQPTLVIFTVVGSMKFLSPDLDKVMDQVVISYKLKIALK